MKKLVGISLFVFWAAVTAIIAVGLIFSQKNPPAPGISNFVLTPTPSLSAPATSPDINIILAVPEIAKHNSIGNCWMIVSGKVYNITSYFGAHPGGVGAIASYCGKDGTQAFTGLPHSSSAASILSGYFIGNLNQVASAQTVQQNVQSVGKIIPPPANRRGIDYGEYDD